MRSDFELDFGPTLLYIDVTNFCSIGCRFCMYKMAHGVQHLNLSSSNLSAIARLARGATKICISGEGEPLTKVKSVLAISSIAREGQTVEVITSGGKSWTHLEQFLDSFESLGKIYRFQPRLRISFDRWHAEKIPPIIYSSAIERRIKHPSPETAAELHFRSVTTDIDWALNSLGQILRDNKIAYRCYSRELLTHVFEIADLSVPIIFKNIVNPGHLIEQDPFTLETYMSSIEEAKGKPFVFGNLGTNTRIPGPDVTVKPNGEIYLYGLETECQWDLNMDISRDDIIETIRKNPVLWTFYSKPLRNILLELNKIPTLSKTISSINNPYWLVKCLRQTHPVEFEKAISQILHNQLRIH